ncbi:AIPR family protein [Streptomyces sp. NPDC003007]
MARASGSGALAARHISAMLARKFGDLISVDDVEAVGHPQRDRAFQGRALAAMAARMLTGCTFREAAASVIDGCDDLGIDAVATSSATGELWLIQAKWSDNVAARADSESALKLLRGFRILEGRGFERFNQQLQSHVAAIDEVLASPNVEVHLVLAVMGTAESSHGLLAAIDSELAEINRFGSIADLRVLSAADFHAAALSELEDPAVELTATFSRGWFHQSLPHSAYHGMVSAQEVARWYQEQGAALFARNMRHPLGDTAVNLGLDSTLRKQPEYFSYFNNGITVLCDSVRTEFFDQRQHSAPARLVLSGASIVNGAQTTAAVYRAFREDPAAVKDATVMVRIICLDDAPEGLARELTRAVNTQNEALRRDFIALDPVQARIRDDFRLSLGKEYVVKRGALLPGPEEGCSVEEAAMALACSYADSALAVLAGRGDALWEDGPHAPYTRLFSTQPSALQIWRSVQLLRTVQESLGTLHSRLVGRGARIADAGRLLIAHIVFQRADLSDIDVPDVDWTTALSQARAVVPDVVSSLVAHIECKFGDRTLVAPLFHDAAAAARLVTDVLADLADPAWRPSALEPRDVLVGRSERKPNSVRLLVSHDRLPDGTLLMYSPTSREEQGIGDWLNADPDRFMAVWSNDVKRPLQWRADGRQYSPSGLIMHMWRESGWNEAPVAVNGAARWTLPSGQTLAELAEEIWQRESNGTVAGGTQEAARQDGASGA